MTDGFPALDLAMSSRLAFAQPFARGAHLPHFGLAAYFGLAVLGARRAEQAIFAQRAPQQEPQLAPEPSEQHGARARQAEVQKS